MFDGKPIIGITGGIGSGKSTVAALFGEMGCAVIDSDRQVTEVYRDPGILQQLQSWWGNQILDPGGALNRTKVADIVFADPQQRRRLEDLVHPRVADLRRRKMAQAAEDPQIKAIVWDTPLLFEAGLRGGCDAIVFVEASTQQRLSRLAAGRGWNEAELQRREKSLWPLDKKREISDYIIDNTAAVENVRGQVSEVLFRILAKRFPDQT